MQNVQLGMRTRRMGRVVMAMASGYATASVCSSWSCFAPLHAEGIKDLHFRTCGGTCGCFLRHVGTAFDVVRNRFALIFVCPDSILLCIESHLQHVRCMDVQGSFQYNGERQNEATVPDNETGWERPRRRHACMHVSACVVFESSVCGLLQRHGDENGATSTTIPPPHALLTAACV